MTRRCWSSLLVVTFMYWEKNNHPMCNALLQALVVFDEYPVENFHSDLRGRTNATNANKLKVKAAEFLTERFGVLHNNPDCAVLLPRVQRQSKKFQCDDYRTCLETKLSPTESCHWDSHHWKGNQTQKCKFIDIVFCQTGGSG